MYPKKNRAAWIHSLDLPLTDVHADTDSMIGNLGTQCINSKSQEARSQLMPETSFEDIEKQVHRERRKKDEDRVWTRFIEQKMQDLQQRQQTQARTMAEVPDLTNLNETTRELALYSKESELAEIAVDLVDAIKEKEKENSEDWLKRGGELEVREMKSPKMLKEKAVKKCHSDSAMNMRRRGFARQLLRAVHTTGKSKEAFKESARQSRSEKYEGARKDESSGAKGGGKSGSESGNESGSENGSEIKNGQPIQATCQRIPLDQPTIHRIEAMRQKMILLLDQILYRLSRIPVPDGEHDLQRRQRRSMEFAVRFSRNYLYHLNRLVTRLQRSVEAIGRIKAHHGQSSRGRYTIDIELTERELVAAHQLLLHALTAYSNHILSAALISHTARPTEALLKLMIDLKEISDRFQTSENCLGSGDSNILQLGSEKELRCKCEAILGIFDEKWKRKASKGTAGQESVVPLVSGLARNQTTPNRAGCANRLRMYNVAELASTNSWRKQQHRAAGIYRSRGNKRDNSLKNKSRRIPASSFISKLQRSGRDVNVPPSKMFYTINQTSSITRRSLSTDEEPKKAEFATVMATTLMSTDSERAASSVTEPCSNAKKSTMIPDQYSHGPSKETALTSANASVNSDRDISPQGYSNCGTASRQLRKNAKNIRLLQPPLTNKREQPLVCDASCQANCQSDSIKATRAHDKSVAPVNKESPMVLILSARTEKCFSEYRWSYQQQRRSRPMYSNSTRNKPWDVVSWISDKLVEELLVQVSEELQITSVIRQMFELEFRDF